MYGVNFFWGGEGRQKQDIYKQKYFPLCIKKIFFLLAGRRWGGRERCVVGCPSIKKP
jgi:hypothetical protein